MKTDLMQLVIDPKIVHNDRYGKDNALLKLDENKTDITIACLKIAAMFSIFVLPLIIGAIGIAILSWLFGAKADVASVLYLTWAIVCAFIAIYGVLVIFFVKHKKDGPNATTIFAQQKQKLIDLLDQRKELNHFINVDFPEYENSQGRELATFLLPQLESHNLQIAQASRMLEFQEAMDANSEIKKAPELEAFLTSRFKAQHADLKNRLETYKVMRKTPANESLELTTSLMADDFNKKFSDDFVQEKANSIGFILDSGESDKLLSA